ncbi:Phenoloxidase 2 [Folsomia candida]|uniref:Phenoloxidase 2 n=1 Tax=Folsomia candida TaxID=158441 RepID=A0A226EMK4_FOLCA|nr:Phenoloxidase 2 [Folsomia candida]
MSSMSDFQLQRDFMYLFERMSEPLGYGIKGSGENMVYYRSPTMEPAMAAATETMMGQVQQTINIQMPGKMPMEELKEISKLCPKSGLFGHFIPNHRKALISLRNVLMDQNSTSDLFNMACFCRDNQMVHPLLFVNALSSCLANRRDTKKFSMPAFYEVMPEIFFSDHIMKQAEKMARVQDSCKNRIMIDRNTTGHQNDPESRLWYFREDIGVNSHHFHWHVVFPGDYGLRNEVKRDRRGELFYYMHHSMISRYDAERLCNGLARTKLLDFDNLVIEEGYFGKLYSTNAGRHWGTRQANTRLVNLVGANDELLIDIDLKVEDLKRWRDRILETIDTGKVDVGDKREQLTEDTGIDVLGDIIENSQDSPHRQYYGVDGFHNMGHLLIAFSHDPTGKFREFVGPMGDTSTAMRDPAFYRWHKYLDDMFDKYKRTLNEYKLNEGKWALKWDGIKIESMKVINSNSKFKENELSTHWAQSDIDLARGLDFYRTEARNGGPVLATFTHLNYDVFKYQIQITNNSTKPVQATVRIFMAPRHDEHGDPFRLTIQRLLYFEMDKFGTKLKPGNNTIERSSLDSSVTIQMDASFDILEKLNRDKQRDDFRTGDDQSRCGCGWPQHLLLPRGTPFGTQFDLFAIVTDWEKDAVNSRSGPTPLKPPCKDALSFCGILNEKYPDARPMGYPFDRRPYNNPEMAQPTEVRNIEEYVKFIPNASTTKIRIIHEADVVKRGKQKDNGMGMVNEKGEVLQTPRCSSSSSSSSAASGGGMKNSSPPPPEINANKDNRGKKILFIPPNRGPPNRFQPGQENKQWQGPSAFYGFRGGREPGMDELDSDWDYVHDNNN